MAKLSASISLTVASGLGSGFAPFASGTFGSLAALLFWRVFIWPMELSLTEKFLCVLAVCIVGIVSSNLLLERQLALGEGTLSKKELDPSYIVIDEWAGMWICLLAMQSSNLITLATAFFLFRFFDITKLGPIASAEKLRNGWGIMADDILAGICSLCVLVALQYFFPVYFI